MRVIFRIVYEMDFIISHLLSFRYGWKNGESEVACTCQCWCSHTFLKCLTCYCTSSNPHNQHLKPSHRIIKTKSGFRDFERLYGPVLMGKAAWVRLSSNLSICILKKSSATKQIGTFKDFNLTVYLNCVFSSSEQWRFNSVTAHGLSSTRILYSD